MPSALIGGSIVPIVFAGVAGGPSEGDSSQPLKRRKKLHMAVALFSLLPEIYAVVQATIAINKLREMMLAPPASVTNLMNPEPSRRPPG